MVKVVARSTVRKDKLLEFKALAARLIAVSKKEKGCLSYELYQDVRNEQIFAFIEEWHDGEALALHMKSKHFQAIVPLLNELQLEPTDGMVYRQVI